EKIKKLRGLIRIATLDEAIIDYAIRIPHKDFEDSIQYYCALRNKIHFLITRNITDYPKAELNIVNPKEYLKISKR
ncbi:MAG: VapC toxin family PIN domain ribonuclease, partial [Spirochaetales bacterium]|nr:VapC toxin family PIN domain ribonuclease [Spirochaetales bacterium]